jgi:uncharacterized protein (TIGR02147 family)
MNEQVKVQQILMRKFADMKSKNPNFSVRALALRLGMQPGATNEILKGQRRVSRKIAVKIADRLMLDPSERTDLLRDFPLKLERNTQRRRARQNDLEVLKLNSDQFALISDWIHFAILSLIRVRDFKSDIGWMAERLGADELEVRKALLRLQQLGIVSRDEKGNLFRTSKKIRTSDDIKDLSLQRMHMNDMDIARRKIQEVAVDKRDFTNFTFKANPKNIKTAKEIIRKAQEDIAEMMDSEDAQDVYRVCMYLFPLTKLDSQNEDV